MPDIGRTIGAVWKLESARIIGGLTRLLHDVGLAEEIAQDALVAALEQWPTAGIPDNPGAWLTTVARRRAVDHIRRSEAARSSGRPVAPALDPPPPDPDDVLRLIFVCCHPSLERDARAALTLRLVAGLSTAEIARAFLQDEPRLSRRIAEAKRVLAAERAGFTTPTPDELAARLPSVLEVIYLIFNEGYAATAGDDLIRADLCREALRLGRMLAELVPSEPEAHGLVALMELQASRAAARTGPDGELVLLHEQNRGRWDPLLIRRGFTALLRAQGAPPGPYVLQAAIAACHAQARTAAATDWPRIASLYDALVHVLPTPVVHLNRAVAIGMARDPSTALAETDKLRSDPALRDYHLLPAVRGDLLSRLGRRAEAAREFERALSLTRNHTEQQFLRRRIAEMSTAAPVDDVPLTLAAAAEAFLNRDDLDRSSVRSYTQTFTRLRRALGDSMPLDEITPETVATVFDMAWGSAAPKTWNRHRATIRSFAAWCDRPALPANLRRRPEPAPPPPGPTPPGPLTPAPLGPLTPAPPPTAASAVGSAAASVVGPAGAAAGGSTAASVVGSAGAAAVRSAATPAELSELIGDERHSLRERTLWRLLFESSAPVSTVLGLNVEDLDLDGRRARAGGRWLTWGDGAARLLPGVVDGRTAGPLFLTGRRPAPGATADRCPNTGRARLSYERAEYLFKQATGHTLGELRFAGR